MLFIRIRFATVLPRTSWRSSTTSRSWRTSWGMRVLRRRASTFAAPVPSSRRLSIGSLPGDVMIKVDYTGLEIDRNSPEYRRGLRQLKLNHLQCALVRNRENHPYVCKQCGHAVAYAQKKGAARCGLCRDCMTEKYREYQREYQKEYQRSRRLKNLSQSKER